MTYSKDPEIRYLLANKRYKMDQPVLGVRSDALRLARERWAPFLEL